ncbi:pentatricopeptide repeat-containing protein At1g74750-like [Malania oleifera]|uniref:pentatricopeptide repeat-containing protein At1g74750-like n=1 Tax=Malania oleifera TaxID=397392 RepID=UPI0025AEA474|nr:pentatricopeptide repeat-containing protein At1g74750-like [Malania oleifera]XP_057951764.1 pentatricopeptide repeat-containing protein At1g74750-like [Malania oleifera]XP_057951765.1 pentatricopeptide repeat-containing protein At1g74750-like [Malania oleifera]XP_057951766.1 pentatricopeptide repeat-containing protein At1g74750-like [Malania oleifera]XP_057951767.1 pentatricopeptide repeat-containing protein At1g74750-like [Malania oleifera]
MLRTKPIGTLSNCARSIFLSGSRCSAADGSSCSCTDDDKCISRKQHTRNEVILPQKPSTIVSKTSARVGKLISGNSSKVVGCHDAEGVDYPTSLSQAVPTHGSLGRSDSISGVSSVDSVQNDVVRSSHADQFVRVGIAAAGFLSDIVNYKLPMLDGSGILKSTQNCMVEPTKSPSNSKSANVKPVKREDFSAVNKKPTPEMKAGPNPTSKYHGTKSKSNKSGSVKGSNRFPKTRMGNSVESCGKSLDTCDKVRPMPQRPKAHPNRFMSNSNSYVQISDNKGVGAIKEGFNKPRRDTKMPMGVAPMARQLASSGHVVESASHILRQLKWGPAAEAALGNLCCSMDAYQANQILKQLQDHSVALDFFYWLKQQAGFKHDEHTYTTMVGILGRARQFGTINKLLDQMVRDGCQPNVVTYNRLIHSYGRANYLNDAINVFNRMQEAGCAPDRVTYCTLIDIHAKAGFLNIAMCMYQRMQEAGLSPDTFTYSVIINCLGKAGHLTDAHKLFCEMVDQGCVPNLVTYNIMIALQAKARNYPTALKLYRDMQTAGFKPDKVTYSIVMEVLGHCGHLQEAEAVFAEMKWKNWVPDEPVYGLLVDLWGKAGNVEKAWEWYQAMLNAGLCPNVPTCNSLLSAFLRVHRLSDAYNLLQSMLALDLNPSLQTYTLLLSCCTDAQTSFDMGFCCELMAITGHPAHMFLLSMPSAGPDGQNVRDHMSKFLDLMHSEDRESKRGLVDAVVDFLHKSGLKEEAGSVWEVAAHRNVYPEAVKEKSSSYWLINLHVMSDGTAKTALSRTLAWFHRQMLRSGISPSRIDIVTGWGRRSRVTGSSLVRQKVQKLLDDFSFPFFTENGNSGCFIGRGEPLSRWLIQPCIERMHLL